MNPFSYIRRKVAEAVVGGITDALEVLEQNPVDVNPDDLKKQLAESLCPKVLEEPRKRKEKS